MHKPHALLAAVPESLHASQDLRQAALAGRVLRQALPASKEIRRLVGAKQVAPQSDNRLCNPFGAN